LKQTGTSRRPGGRNPVFATARRSHNINKRGLRGI